MQEQFSLSLNPAQANQFARDNGKAMGFLTVATQDYIAARCCLSNWLVNGLVLAAQAVEKYLKAYILFLVPSKNIRHLSHKIRDLATELLALDPNLDLLPYEELLVRLEAHYQTRYPDNHNASTKQSTDEIHEIDNLIILVNQKMPLPWEVKLRSGLYAKLLYGEVRGYDLLGNDEYWLLRNNHALNAELKGIVEKCNLLEVFFEDLRQQRLNSSSVQA